MSCADKKFCAKLAPKYSGPYKITNQKSPVIFELKHMHNNKKYIAHIKKNFLFTHKDGAI